MALSEHRPHPRLSPSATPLDKHLDRTNVVVWLSRLVIVALLGATLWIALGQFTPPRVVPASVGADVFSAERAMSQLQVIASAPHPAGSAEHAVVAQYLVDQLASMGLSPEIETTTGVAKTDAGDVWAGTVHNIVARIPGTDSTRAILLAAHYDSVPTGPGAGDCGTCVVTVLETVRALQASAPLRNDVIVLFVDSEEHDMLGSKTFMAQNPLASDIGVALNFEAIGTTGASILNYVAPDSGQLTQTVLDALPHPLASSAMSGLGIGNDILQYTSHGAAGYEFSIFGGVQAYHSQLDSVARVDPRSVQDNGSNLLAVTRRLGNLDLTTNSSGDRIFFNLARDHAVFYPIGWALPLSLLSLLLVAGLLVVGLRRRDLTYRGVALGVAVFLGGVLGVVLLVTLVEWGLSQLNPNYQVFMGGSGYHDGLLLLTYAGLAALVALLLHAWTRARVGTLNLAAGAMSLWAVLGVVVSLLYPAASFLFVWPLLGAAAALSLMYVARARDGNAGFSWWRTAAAVVALVPAVLLLAPVVIWSHALVAYVELPTRLPLAATSALFVVLGLTLVLPFLPLPEVKWRWAFPAMTAVVTVGLAVVALAVSGFSASQPRPDYVAYVLNADTGTARWISVGTRTDAWTEQFFADGSEKTEYVPLPSELPDTKFAALQAPAPLADLPAPQLTLTDTSTEGSARVLRLHFVSPRGAPNVQFAIEGDSAITRLSINGNDADLGAATKSQLTVQYYGLPAEGIDLTLVTAGQGPVRVAVEERSNGLPDVPSMTIQPRPASIMPAPFENADPTIVQKSFTF